MAFSIPDFLKSLMKFIIKKNSLKIILVINVLETSLNTSIIDGASQFYGLYENSVLIHITAYFLILLGYCHLGRKFSFEKPYHKI